MKTTAKFHAIGSFLLRSRDLFVIVGDVLEGEVVAGMQVHASRGASSVTKRVASVEYVDVIHEGKSHIGLVLKYEGLEELEILRGFEVCGATLQLESP